MLQAHLAPRRCNHGVKENHNLIFYKEHFLIRFISV